MTEQKDVVSGVVAQDTSLPKPEFSEPQSASPTSALSTPTIEELLDSPAFEDKINRMFKRTTDKRFSKLEKGEQTMTEVLAALKEQGATIPEAVEREYQLTDYINERISQAVPVPQGNGMPAAPAKVEGQFDSLAVINSFSLDTNDAEVRELLKGKYRNPDHFNAEAAKLALKKAGKPAPSASSSSPLDGGGTSTQGLSDAEKEVKASRLQVLFRAPTSNKVEIEKLKKELGWT
jgi:hypothetical protein